MEVRNDQAFDVVFTFVKHPYFGMLVEANAVLLLANGGYSLTFQRIREKTTAYYHLNAEQTEAVNIIELFEPEAIIKRFYTGTKKIKPAEFYTKHYNADMHKLVRAFIEKKMVRILELIKNYPLFITGKAGVASDKPVNYSEEPATVLFHFRRDEPGTNYFATIKQSGERVNFYENDSEILVSQPAWLLTDTGLHHFPNHIDGNKIRPFFQKKFIHVDPRNEDVYMEKFVKPLLENHDVYAKGFDIVTEQLQAYPVLRLMQNFGENCYVTLYFHYGNWNFPFHVGKKVNVSVEKKGDSYLFHRIRRSYNWESEKLRFLRELGLVHFEGSLFSLDDSKNNYKLIEWLNQNADALKREGFEIVQDNNEVTYYIGDVQLQVQVSRENDWFDVRAIVQFGSFSIPFVRLRKNIIDHRREFVLPDGSIAILPEEWFTRFAKITHFAELDGDSLRLKNIHYPLLEDIGDFMAEEALPDLGWGAALESHKIPEYDLPAGLNVDMRSYQKEGYNWLRFMLENKVGPMLADDMGLGKTVQTLAVLQHYAAERRALLKTQTAKEKGQEKTENAGGQNAIENQVHVAEPQKVLDSPSVVIAPKSLLYNWKAEAAKFTPGLKVLIYSGISRNKMLANFHKYDMVVMSYGTMRNDVEALSKFHFNCIVLDESQAIKNPSSQTARNLQQLSSRYRMALTGTPIENTLLDIWSQMHFLNQGLLGSYGYFDKQFIRPIEKSTNKNKSEELRQILDPYVLRRTKKQVASELPEKIEKIHFCEMTEEQAEVYEKVKSQYRNEILGQVQEIGISRSRLKIFNGLMHLRQLALNPHLKNEDYTGGSGKDREIRHMLLRALEGGHKVLIFSQFVSYLSVFKEMLESEGIKYAYLDGSMELKHRSEAIDDFQNNKETRVFLLSLRAGNSGINLTAADYVFLADPWWNPFTMRQAEDRAHRIGQDKTVFSYSFITRNTIEEKILHLQKKKTDLAGSIIPNEENILSTLNVEELEDLLL
ncbi:MAG: DEAD/DEAH box helicase [Bacteroidia bacterium]|nr:DEAD/DEAH box helicase [Bacteroidia bacterium]